MVEAVTIFVVYFYTKYMCIYCIDSVRCFVLLICFLQTTVKHVINSGGTIYLQTLYYIKFHDRQ